MDNSKNYKIPTQYADVDTSIPFIYSFSELPSITNATPPVKMVGKVADKDGFLLKFVCCADRNLRALFNENDTICATYVELNSVFVFNSRVVSLREALESDNIKVSDFDGITTSFVSSRFMIMEVLPLTEPMKKQRREYFRVPLDITIYYKTMYNRKELADAIDVRLDSEKAAGEKLRADRGMLEDEGYKKLVTLDVSAGGFRARTQAVFRQEDYLDCIILLENEALPAVAQIKGCKKNYDSQNVYELRCSFYKMSDAVRDRLTRYILLQQRVVENKFRRRF